MEEPRYGRRGGCAMSPTAEVLIRFGCFAGVFGLMAAWELAAPCRALRSSRPHRWLRNLTVAAVNTLLVRLVMPAGAVGVAWLAARREWGLFNVLEVPGLVAVPLSVILLDFVIYLQHVAFHAVPVFWRLHRVHHADVDVDVTTGDRFHPVEILLSMLIKAAVVVALGAPAAGVLAFEVLLNATSLFNHSNVALPARWEGIVRAVLVTPGMHRVHHSVDLAECTRNFGFNLPWWDRLFGTYTAEPARGHHGMVLGVAERQDPAAETLPWMLAAPFLKETPPASEGQ